MIEALLKLIIGILGIVTFNIIYTNIFYKQKHNFKRTSLFISLTALLFIFVGALWKLIDQIQNIKYLGQFTSSINKIYGKFDTYIPKPFLFIWLLVPLIIVFIILIILGTNQKRKIRNSYKEWKDKEEAKKEVSSSEANSTTKSDEKPKDKSADVQAEETNSDDSGDKENIDDAKEELPLKQASQEVLDVTPNNEKIDYVSYNGLKDIYLKAKEGLQISKFKKDAYIAVYINEKGLDELKKVLSENSLDITGLTNSPSVVYFTSSKVQTMSLSKQVQKAKEKNK